MERNDKLTLGFSVATFAAVITTIALAFWVAPIEGQMGIVQKIFYFHVPSAVSSYLGFGLCGVASIFYLLKPSKWADRAARAGAEVGVVFGIAVLITGPLWGYKSWGTFWEWEPRLTSLLLTFLIYTSYLLLRQFGGEGDAARKVGAVMGVLGLVGIGIIRISVSLWGGLHPQVVTGKGGGLHPDMVPAFAMGMISFLMLSALLILLRMRLAYQAEELEELHLLAADIEYELDA